MEPNYIQLPPLPSDMPIELIEIVWAYARMEESEKENFLEFLRKNAKSDIGGWRERKIIGNDGGIKTKAKSICQRVQFANAGIDCNINCPSM